MSPEPLPPTTRPTSGRPKDHVIVVFGATGDLAKREVERLWEVSVPLLEKPPPVEPSAPGSWGPPSIDTVVSPHRWHLPEAD